MDTRQFLTSVLGDTGHYCAAGLVAGVMTQKFYTSIDSIAEASKKFDEDGTNAYFALATFKSVEAGRKANNVEQLKSLFLDLDCKVGKEDKTYSSQAEAIKHLRDFVRTRKLPKPTVVVNSGHGIHVYWVLNTPCNKDTWLKVATKLKAACVEFGLKIDTSVTADAARVLRVPNTHNYGSNPPKDVFVIGNYGAEVGLDQFYEALPDAYVAVVPAREFSAEDTSDMQAILGMEKYTKKFIRLAQASLSGGGCKQVRRAFLEPNSLSYNDWLHVLSIAKHCEDGDMAIHVVSRGYDGYSPEETQKIAESIETPHLCSTFAQDNPSGCEGCPHKSKIRTPIKLCMEVKEASTNEIEITVSEPDADADADSVSLPQAAPMKHTIPPYPNPYFRAESGGVYVRKRDKDGNPDEIMIYNRDLYLTKRIRDPLEGPCYEFEHHTAREGIKRFVVAGVKLSSKEEFRKAMGINDIFIFHSNADGLMQYIAAWIEQLKGPNGQDELVARTQFGWTENLRSFVVGDREIFADKVVSNPPSSRTAQFFPYFTKRGTLDEWKEITAFYNRPSFEEHQMMFGLSFGSPLMVFIPSVSGAIYHLTSADSGYGKTTGMFGGASVWGNPKRLVLKGKDTGNSVWHRAEIYKNIVLYVDELSNYGDKDASDFAYAIADGEQRNRQSNAGQNVERLRGEEWNLLAGTNGNVSLIEKMSSYRAIPKGEAQRVLEATARQLLFSPDEAATARELNERLEQNYGHAGDIFIQHVLQNMESVEKLVRDFWTRIMREADLGPQNRFWVAKVATTIAGLTIAKHLELHDWDLDNLFDWSIRKLREKKHEVKDMDIDIGDLVAQFYNDNVRGILRLQSMGEIEDPEMKNILTPIMSDSLPMYKWVGRHEYDVNKLYILPRPFKNWCVSQGHHYSAVRDLIFAQLNGSTNTIRLGRGTKLNLPPQRVIELSWDRDPLGIGVDDKS